jgi:type IV pilus assembly protein PilB
MTAGPLWPLGFFFVILRWRGDGMRIGELLIRNGLITEQQLELALKAQAQSRIKIGEQLIQEGAITERQLLEVLEFQLGIPSLQLEDEPVDLEAVRLVEEAAAREYLLLPFEKQGGKLKVAMADPQNEKAIQQLQRSTGMIVQPFLAARSELKKAIDQHYSQAEVLRQLTSILAAAREQEVEYIHFDPQEHGLLVKFRKGQDLKTYDTLYNGLRGAFIARLKREAGLNAAEQSLPLEGQWVTTIKGTEAAWRVFTLPTMMGESILLRLSEFSGKRLRTPELGFREELLQIWEHLLLRPGGGLVLVAGPHGSGRTTLLYAAVNHLLGEDRRIVTVEERVERRVLGTTQVEVKSRLGLSYASVLRAVLLQDPNIVMIGDIRDAETAEAAVEAALGGRLVIAGIHSSQSLHALSRLQSWGIDGYRLAAALAGVVSQRVVRRICKRCSQSTAATDEEVRLFEANGLLREDENHSARGNFRVFVKAHIDGKPSVLKGEGCRVCDQTGFHGHTGVHEMFEVDEPMRKLLIHRRPIEEFEQQLKKSGFKPILHDGLWKSREGWIRTEDLLRALQDFTPAVT